MQRDDLQALILPRRRQLGDPAPVKIIPVATALADLDLPVGFGRSR